MSIEAFISHFESAVGGLPEGGVSATTEFKNLKGWDSMALIYVLAMVDDKYGIQLSGPEIQQCATIGDVFAAVVEKRKNG